MRALNQIQQTPVDKGRLGTSLWSFQSGCRFVREFASALNTNASDGSRRVYLCDRIRPERYPGNRLTCHQIWHEMWKNGEERPPPRVGRDIQMRPLGKKRRRGRREDGGSNEEAGQEGQDDTEQEEP
ncbi:hypothetical protein PR003_g8687 [Phytophthora rubi]|uniref:Uncharacterized protein n=1 Tax=Phytophthora rubi TaxID=129364 RepID=A0A6A4FAH5_9STRA|nr:hypothetical protein PR003_g8687 [Phytophthora rubi]